MSVVIATKQIEEVINKTCCQKTLERGETGYDGNLDKRAIKKKKKKKKVEGKAEGREGTTHGNVGVTETM
jgi:hypothetical protein